MASLSARSLPLVASRSIINTSIPFFSCSSLSALCGTEHSAVARAITLRSCRAAREHCGQHTVVVHATERRRGTPKDGESDDEACAMLCIARKMNITQTKMSVRYGLSLAEDDRAVENTSNEQHYRTTQPSLSTLTLPTASVRSDERRTRQEASETSKALLSALAASASWLLRTMRRSDRSADLSKGGANAISERDRPLWTAGEETKEMAARAMGARDPFGALALTSPE